MGRTENAARRGPAAARHRARAASPLAAGLLLAVAGGGGKAAADWQGQDATSSLTAPADGVRLASPFSGLPAPFGPGLPRWSPSRAPAELAALVAPLRPDAGPLGALDAAEVTSPILSGLPWRSGASCGETGFAAWRGGRALDVNVSFVKHASWQEMFSFVSTAYYRGVARQTPQLVTSLALLPHSEKKRHAACAAGAFDANFRQIGSLLAQAGAGSAIVRLGWEANVGSDSHPWGIDSAEEIPAYVECFRHAAAALRTTAPGLKIEWTNAKKGALPVSVLAAYPGDAYVDLFGVHYYDNDPAMPTQAAWDEMLNATRRNVGVPHGIGQWLSTAQAYGKKLSVSEWGVWRKSTNPRPDNPTYVENMYRFFRVNAASIAYENYYNCPVVHKIFPGDSFPLASAAYQRLWSAGQ